MLGHAAGLLTPAPRGSTIHAMDLEDLFPSKPGDPLVELGKQDLDPMSIEELQARDRGAEGRDRAGRSAHERAETHRSAAEELFKKP